jgi:hypothetical protein
VLLVSRSIAEALRDRVKWPLAVKSGSPDERNARPKSDISENLAGFCC